MPLMPLPSRHDHAGPGMSSARNEGSVPSDIMKRRKSKHVSRACNPCRRKKTRCNGERPTCALCVICNDECTYDTAQDRRRPLSKAYVAALEDRVAWLEMMLEDRREGEGAGESGEGSEVRGQGVADSSTPERRPMRPNGKVVPQEPVESLQIDDATGDVREYGPTSVFKHLLATHASPASLAQSETSPSNTNTTSTGNIAILSLPDGFNEAMHLEALQAFFVFFNSWCWWVDEKRFRNDMGVPVATTGTVVKQNLRTAYYSPLLHLAILAIGVMYLDNRSYSDRELISDSFARIAATYFEEEIEAAKLSGVIGLMLLGTYHAGHARQSLGYIYSGTGMRLTRILGLGIDASSWVDKGLISLETKRSRDRVWHVAYIQDKLWSTYVGRAPAPTLSHWRMPFHTVDMEEDARPWGTSDGFGSEPGPRSWMSSTFTWTCKLARIIELVLTNIYTTQRTIYSDKARNTKYEICVLLEKWHGELPEPLRVSSAILRSQSVPMTLPHVLVMNMMFHFAVILLNRPDYCDTSRPPRATTKTQSATITTTATERCNQAAVKVLRLAELFDRTFGLRHAPVSMTQFTFTAGTIHLLGAANGKSLESDTASVKGCIAVLHSMGQTWKCASQSGDVLQRLLHEWNPKRASSDGAPATATKLNASGGVNIQEMLQQNPEMAQQLQRLGWAPPRLGIVPSSSSGFNPDPETLLTAPSYTQAETPNAATTQQPFVPPDTGMNDISWMSQPSGWTDHSYTSNFPPTQDQSLFDMLIGNDGMAPEAWSNRLFNVEAGGAWPPGWGASTLNSIIGMQSNQ